MFSPMSVSDALQLKEKSMPSLTIDPTFSYGAFWLVSTAPFEGLRTIRLQAPGAAAAASASALSVPSPFKAASAGLKFTSKQPCSGEPEPVDNCGMKIALATLILNQSRVV